MAVTEGEDGYSDDDLDALESEDFLELQQRALQATQQPRQALNVDARTHTLPPVIDTPPGIVRHHRGNTSGGLHAQAYLNTPSSDYGDLDDEVLDTGLLDDPREMLASKPANHALPLAVRESTQREQWRRQRFSVPQQGGASVPSRCENQIGPAFALPERAQGPTRDSGRYVDEHEMLDEGDVECPPTERKLSVDALHAKVEEVWKLFNCHIAPLRADNDGLDIAGTGQASTSSTSCERSGPYQGW